MSDSVLGFQVTVLLQNLLILTVKKIKNWLIFDAVKTYKHGANFGSLF